MIKWLFGSCTHYWNVLSTIVVKPIAIKSNPNALMSEEMISDYVIRMERLASGVTTQILVCDLCGKIKTYEILGNPSEEEQQ